MARYNGVTVKVFLRSTVRIRQFRLYELLQLYGDTRQDPEEQKNRDLILSNALTILFIPKNNYYIALRFSKGCAKYDNPTSLYKL
jgi:hypothetical protein